MKSILAVMFLVLIVGCETVVLKGGREEVERAHQRLEEAGIQSSLKEQSNLWMLNVPSEASGQALRVLGEGGFFRTQGKGIEESYAQRSLIPSPHEEQVRYRLAQAVDLEHTLKSWPGVLDAKVHATETSASVWLKHSKDSTHDASQIKKMVMGALGLTEQDNIHVLFATPVRLSHQKTRAPNWMRPLLAISLGLNIICSFLLVLLLKKKTPPRGVRSDNSLANGPS